jgi:isovaleryl-CoA dehydrogenase
MLREFVSDQVEPQAAEYNQTGNFDFKRNTCIFFSFFSYFASPCFDTHTYNYTESFNKGLFQSLGNQGHALGLLGLTVDDAYGGVGWDAAAVAVVHEELAYSDPAFCLSYLAHSLLLVNNLYVNGNQLQRTLFLPELTAGTKIGGMAMSEPAAGTDVLGMQTNARSTTENGKKEWIIQGRKLWITNGTLDGGQTTGDVFLVYARTGPGRSDITTFVVEKNMDGFTVGQRIKQKLGMRASPTAELVLDQVVVPDETHRVGTVNGATLCMMRNLEIERVGLAAMATGIARRCLDEMKAYAAQRTAFGQDSLYGFGQIQAHLAESYASYMAGRSYLYTTAKALDLQQHGQGLDADGVKLFCAPMAKQIADRAIQVMGGYGYVGEYTVERMWRDAKVRVCLHVV